MADSFNLAKPNRTIHVGVILMDGYTEILDVAPVDALSSMSTKVLEFAPDLLPEHLKDQFMDMDIHWVNENGRVGKLTAGANIQVTDTYETCPPLDIALMGASHAGHPYTEADLAFIRKTYEHCSAFITICGGLTECLMAGILKGKTVTGPAPFLEEYKKNYPDTTFVRKRWHHDGKMWTSGTLLNGLDLMRAFLTETWGAGEGSLAKFTLDLGHWPVRDVDFKDAGHDM